VPKLSADQWADARAQREAGASLSEVAKTLGVDRALVSRKAKAEGWGDGSDVVGLVQKRAHEIAHGVSPASHACDPQKKAAAIDAAASKVAGVVERHQREWDRIGQLQDEALADRHEDPEGSFVKAKLAKISAETLAIKQTGERKAHGLDKEDTTPTIVIERSTA
jgi:hypothetical protein